MAISRIGTPQAGRKTDGTNVTLTFDVAPVKGDVIVVWGGTFNRAGITPGPVPASSPGYTSIYSYTAGAPLFDISFKRAAGTETTVVCQGSGNSVDGVAYACMVLRGVNPNALDAQGANQGWANAGPTTSTNPDPPAVTTVTANAWVLIAAVSTVSDAAITAPTNYTTNHVTINANASTNDITVAGSAREIASPASENPASWTLWNSGTWVAVSVGLAPAKEATDAAGVRLGEAGSQEEVVPPRAYLEATDTVPGQLDAAEHAGASSQRVSLAPARLMLTAPSPVSSPTSRQAADAVSVGGGWASTENTQRDVLGPPAVVTESGARATSDNQSSYTSDAVDAAAGDLLIVLVMKEGSTNNGYVYDAESTYTRVGGWAVGGGLVLAFVRDALLTGPANGLTVTYDCTGDPATACVLDVAVVRGALMAGSEAVRQVAYYSGASGFTPQIDFSVPTLAKNATVVAVGCNLNSPSLGPPAGWTERLDTGVDLPATGLEWASRDEGFSGTSVDWTTACGSDFVAFGLEVWANTYAVAKGEEWEEGVGPVYPGFPIRTTEAADVAVSGAVVTEKDAAEAACVAAAEAVIGDGAASAADSGAVGASAQAVGWAETSAAEFARAAVVEAADGIGNASASDAVAVETSSPSAEIHGFVSDEPTSRYGDQAVALTNYFIAIAQQFTVPETGTREVGEIGFWEGVGGWGATSVRMAIFTRRTDPDAPLDMVANSDIEFTPDPVGIVKAVYGATKPQVVGGTTYWIGLLIGGTGPGPSRFTVGTTGTCIYRNATYPTWPTAVEWETHTDYGRDFSFFATIGTLAGEQATVFASVVPSESARAVVAELPSGDGSASAADAATVAFAEAVDVATTEAVETEASDPAAVEIADAASGEGTASAADTLGLAAQEAAVLDGSTDVADGAGILLAETVSGEGTGGAADEGAVGAAEDRAVAVETDGQDALAAVFTESAEVASFEGLAVEASDPAAVGVGEVAEVVATVWEVEVGASDAAAVGCGSTAAPAYVSAQGFTPVNTDPFDLSITVPSNCTLLTVSMGQEAAAGLVFNGVTLGGTALTLLDRSPYVSGKSGNIEVWYLVNPPTGPGTLTVDPSSANVGFRVAVGYFTGVNPSAPVRDYITKGGVSSALQTIESDPIDAAVGDLAVVAAVDYSSDNGTILIGSQTDAGSYHTTNTSCLVGQKAIVADGTTTMSATGNYPALVAFVLAGLPVGERAFVRGMADVADADALRAAEAISGSGSAVAAEALSVAELEAMFGAGTADVADEEAVDLGEVGAGEPAGAPATEIASADVIAAVIEEAADIFSDALAEDALEVGAADASHGDGQADVADGVAPGAADAAEILGSASPADAPAIVLAEAAWAEPVGAQDVEAADPATVAVAEVADVVAREAIPVDALDAAGLALAEGADLSAALAPSEALAAGAGEAASGEGTGSAGEAGAVGMAESAAIEVAVAVSDALAAAGSEAPAVAVMVAAADAACAALAEAPFPLVSVDAADLAALAGEGAPDVLAVVLAAADALRVAPSEAVAILASLAAADAPAVAVGPEGAAVYAGEAVGVEAADGAAVASAEAAAIFAALGAIDAPGVGAAEFPLAWGEASAADPAGVAASEAPDLAIILTAAEAAAFGMSEAAALLAALGVADAAVVVPSEAVHGIADAAAAEALAAAAGERGLVLLSLDAAAEALGVRAADLAEALNDLAADDETAVVLVERGDEREHALSTHPQGGTGQQAPWRRWGRNQPLSPAVRPTIARIIRRF